MRLWLTRLRMRARVFYRCSSAFFAATIPTTRTNASVVFCEMLHSLSLRDDILRWLELPFFTQWPQFIPGCSRIPFFQSYYGTYSLCCSQIGWDNLPILFRHVTPGLQRMGSCLDKIAANRGCKAILKRHPTVSCSNPSTATGSN